MKLKKIEAYNLVELLAAVKVTCCKNLVTVPLYFLNKAHYLPSDPRVTSERKIVEIKPYNTALFKGTRNPKKKYVSDEWAFTHVQKFFVSVRRQAKH